MFVELIFLIIYIYKQYNPETAHQNAPKLKHIVPIKKQNANWNRIDNIGIDYV